MMKIIIINGSPRKNGATAQILRAMEKRLSEKGAETEIINISDLKISACQGCCSCYKTGRCFLEDDGESLSDKIAAADGLIIGSPTYASNVSGQLKQFIDRGHFVIEQLLYGKYAVSVASGENYGSSDASKILTKLLKYSGAKMSGKIILNLPFGSSLTDNFSGRIISVSDKLFSDISSGRMYIFQSLVHKIIFNIGIKPFVKNKGESYSGVISKWKRYGII